jgi:hypothetical protein
MAQTFRSLRRASVTGPFYATKVLPEVVKHYNNARPSTGTRGIRLLHDNATVHKSAVMKECIGTHDCEKCNGY